MTAVKIASMPHGVGVPKTPRILFLDAYDSFSNNIIALVKQHITAEVCLLRIDDPRYLSRDDDAFLALLKSFDAVIAGPGPGSPEKPSDVGLMARLWKLKEEDQLPILGICLGFQSMALAFGARVERLKEPRHGIIARVSHNGQSIFTGAGDVHVTLYNSLCVKLSSSAATAAPRENRAAVPNNLWTASTECLSLLPLAWAFDDKDNGNILMGIKHTTKPFWAVQYHPESVCTNTGGASVVVNWWAEVLRWSFSQKGHRRRRGSFLGDLAEDMSLPWRVPLQDVEADGVPLSISGLQEKNQSQLANTVSWDVMPWEAATSEAIQKAFHGDGRNVVLASGTHPDGKPVNPTTGRFSILAYLESSTIEQLEYHVQSRQLIRTAGGQVREQTPVDDIWRYLDDYMTSRRASGGSADLPFWGGLVGFVSYEACLNTIDVEPSSGAIDSKRPDICFVWTDRSIVLDHVERRIFVQTTRVEDQQWQESTFATLRQLDAAAIASQHSPNHTNLTPFFTTSTQKAQINNRHHLPPTPPPHIHGPTQATYHAQILACQSAIRAGDAYELCLTAQTRINLPRHPTSARALHARLQRHNPAPFSALLPLHHHDGTTTTILSSSPERFLSWSRAGRVQFRPIKGTVRKQPGVTRRDAEALLASDKERAENLMIVDLIRHDLAGSVGPGVRVTKLMQVEEYETVYQLVSVIEGDLPPSGGAGRGDVGGIQVLRTSLPPGSMTGAPKKRACQLLREIEGQRPRGLYAGVLGYLDVGAGGDFSVVIRTAVRCEDGAKRDAEGGEADVEVWTVGAGGAVTAQSTVEGEWEEMLTKRDALLGVFLGED